MIPQKEGVVTIQYDDGKEYTGNYRIVKGWVTVKSIFGTEKAQLISPDANPEPLVRFLLHEIIKKALKK